MDWNAALTRVDSRHEYNEERLISLVPLNGRLYTVVHVTRGNALRVISLRKANNREVDFYERET
jgi:uncharacterized DUF497 family protein